MAFLGGTFDANNVAPAAPIEILPPGDYPVQIVQSEMRDTKSGDGQMLWLEMEIIDGPARGRKLWDRLNLVNQNAQAVEIAQRTLSAICHAIGKLQVSDSVELHLKPMLAKVAVRPAGPDKSGIQRKAQNEVKGYSPLQGAQQRPAPFQQAQAPAYQPPAPPPMQQRPAPAAASTPPWRRSA